MSARLFRPSFSMRTARSVVTPSPSSGLILFFVVFNVIFSTSATADTDAAKSLGPQVEKTAADVAAAAEAAAVVEEKAAVLGVTAQREIDVGVRREQLARIARGEASLPEDAVLRLLLEVSSTHPTALRERANALRMKRRTLTSSMASSGDDAGTADTADGGALDDDGDGGVAIVTVTGDKKLEIADIDNALLVIKKVLVVRIQAETAASEKRRAEQEIAKKKADEEERVANEAREESLRQAQQARTARLEAVLARAAAVSGVQGDIARAARTLVEDGASRASTLDQKMKAVALTRTDVLSKTKGDEKLDAVFRRVMTEQDDALDGVLNVLDEESERVAAFDAEIEQPVTGVNTRLPSTDDEEREAEIRLAATRDTARQALSNYQETLALARLDSAKGALALASELDELRLSMLPLVSRELRSDLHGFTSDGLDNVKVALRHVGVTVQFHLMRRAWDITHVEDRLSDVVALGQFVLSFGWGLLLLFLAVFIWRRAPTQWPKIRAWLVARSSSTTSARLSEGVLSLMEEAGPQLFRILVVVWLGDTFTAVAPEPELTVVLEIVVWILVYRLAARLSHLGILRLARRRLSLTALVKLKILRTVRMVLRYGFVSAYLLSVARALVGAGVLFSIAKGAAIVGALPMVLVLIGRWRDNIVKFYLDRWPDTKLAGLVASHREDWQGFVFAVAAFVYVAAEGALAIGREFILGFDQTRKALAYLFRLRIERQAKQRGRTSVDVDALPEKLRAVFSDAPVEESRRVVKSRVTSAIVEAEHILETRRGRSMLVDAPWGAGLTTWLNQLEENLGDEAGVRRYAPTTRVQSAAEVIQAIGDAITDDATTTPTTAKELAEQTLALDLDVVIVDGLEWLFLRELGGYEPLDALLDVVRRTRHRVSWILGSSSTTVEFLSKTRRLDTQVSYRHTIGAWDEDEIRSLILNRQRESGISVSFQDLLIQGMNGRVDTTSVVETEEGYIRLLWNFAEGNPRIAQHFWLRSLVVKNEREVSVRLYDAPVADDLEGLPEAERFMLFSTFLHRALSPEEISKTSRLPVGAVDAHVGRGLDLGFYSARADGRLSITTSWHLATRRFLRRKNLI